MLIVETGVGVPNANTYLSLADADAYHALRGNTWGTVAAATRSGALVYASQWLDTTYNWRGARLTDTQGLAMPTVGGVDDSGGQIIGIPVTLKHAVAEAALAHLSSPLNAAQVSKTAESIGDWSASYSSPPRATRFVETMVRGLVVSVRRLESMG